eukprot:gene20786-1126_t
MALILYVIVVLLSFVCAEEENTYDTNGENNRPAIRGRDLTRVEQEQWKSGALRSIGNAV